MTTGQSVAALVRACHPEPTVAVTAIAAALAHRTGAPVLRMTAAFGTGQLVTGWSNDWLDRSRDLASGRSDKPLVQGRVGAGPLGAAAALAGAACVPLSLRLGRRAGAAHLAAVASALSYNAGLKGSALSFLPYAVSFGLLPSVATLAGPTRRPAAGWAGLAGALLGVGAHLANALPDLEQDLATGVRGLPHRLGRPAATALTAGLLLPATGLLAYGPGRPGLVAAAALPASAALTAVGLVRSRRPGSRAAFLSAVGVALLDVALLVARGARLERG